MHHQQANSFGAPLRHMRPDASQPILSSPSCRVQNFTGDVVAPSTIRTRPNCCYAKPLAQRRVSLSAKHTHIRLQQASQGMWDCSVGDARRCGDQGWHTKGDAVHTFTAFPCLVASMPMQAMQLT